MGFKAKKTQLERGSPRQTPLASQAPKSFIGELQPGPSFRDREILPRHVGN